MTIVRDPILTSGFYWYDAPLAQGPGFHQWLRDNVALVKVRKSASITDDGIFAPITDGPKQHTWVLFEVLFPVLWLDPKKFGFPNKATKDTDISVASSLEPEKDTLDKIADSVKSVVPFLAPVSTGLLALGGLLGLGYFFRKEIFNDAKERVRKFRSSRSRRV
jgi:hypothetical protein